MSQHVCTGQRSTLLSCGGFWLRNGLQRRTECVENRNAKDIWVKMQELTGKKSNGIHEQMHNLLVPPVTFPRSIDVSPNILRFQLCTKLKDPSSQYENRDTYISKRRHRSMLLLSTVVLSRVPNGLRSWSHLGLNEFHLISI
jgi:hypothetical protein